ncbi:NAD(P)H-dependent oxidoreductase [Herbiconiux sp. VKM Ac-1786]|jgi:NAD(P)H-dependent FMN reductase|uniref:NADPH-dependent FMN reductase n=1 Tax=Herbiconiux sp. VKM Ac-1786 TaxID=2783824 RepID=UPI00188CB7FD|nr:NADPH-dependent FMN reductase [Herbiconiux sp. VKM Ac-1786]MBF4572355.1 NAD(P)H-dependent oxidoreductase [Herbiconiux sp. VKM Ac-1786]
MTQKSVLVLVGSLRAASTNRQLAEAAVDLAPEGIELAISDQHRELPLYNEDIDVEGTLPASVVAFREAVAAADAVLVVTPEHNGTMPANLKNAIDWSSRPFGTGAIVGKPVAVIGTAFGQYGGVWAQDEARKALGIAGAKVIEPTLSVPNSVVRFAETHPKDDAEIVAQLEEFINAFAASLDAVEAEQQAA